jgi:hypothetical protein
MAGVGERPLGVQASQLAATARWLHDRNATQPLTLVAVGPRTSLMALCAAALEPVAIGSVELHGAYGSLKEIIEQNGTVDQTPELFCFGLLEKFDISTLAAAVAPRPVTFVTPSERARQELAGLKELYAMLGKPHEPCGPRGEQSR